MILLENYHTASQKYGIELVKQLSELGLPPQYLLSACRFVKENNIPLLSIINQFKEWTKYVIKYNKYDVNKLSYDDFCSIISQEKSKHIVPNLIWQNEIASLGKLNNAKDVQKIPVKNQWCIKSQDWFDRYTDKGYVFFVIYLPNEQLPLTFVVVAVRGGNVEYYDTQDYEQFENLRSGNENNSDHERYQRKLPDDIVSYLYNIAATQTEERENKIKTENKNYKINKKMRKQVIRLTEGDLHRFIKESVRQVLKEARDWSDYDKAVQIQKDADNKALDDETFEFMNTPNAAQNYSKFPRISAQRNHEYDSLANGSQRVQQYKALKAERDKQKEISDREMYDRELLSNLSENDIKNAIEKSFGFKDFCRYADDKLSYSIVDIDYNDELDMCATIEFNGVTKGDVYDVSMRYAPSFVSVKPENRFGFKKFEGVLELTARNLKYFRKSNDDLGNAEWEQDELLYGHD